MLVLAPLPFYLIVIVHGPHKHSLESSGGSGERLLGNGFEGLVVTVYYYRTTICVVVEFLQTPHNSQHFLFYRGISRFHLCEGSTLACH